MRSNSFSKPTGLGHACSTTISASRSKSRDRGQRMADEIVLDMSFHERRRTQRVEDPTFRAAYERVTRDHRDLSALRARPDAWGGIRRTRIRRRRA